MLVLRKSFFDQGGDENLNNDGYYQVLTPLQAATIDRKMDDGKSKTGDVVGAGAQAYCDVGGPNNDSYAESGTNDKMCTLGFIIEK